MSPVVIVLVSGSMRCVDTLFDLRVHTLTEMAAVGHSVWLTCYITRAFAFSSLFFLFSFSFPLAFSAACAALQTNIDCFPAAAKSHLS
jgi:hypothetical protein